MTSDEITGERLPGAGTGGGRAAAVVRAARARYRWLDHLCRAAVRYDTADGGRLAAAVTYYAFFAVFALALLSFAVLGYVLDLTAVQRTVQGYLADNLPSLHLRSLRQARHAAGIIGLTVLTVTGVFWVDTLRSAMRAIWQLDEYPGGYWRRQVGMLGALAGLGLLLAASLAVAALTQAAAHWLLLDAADAHGAPARLVLAVLGFLLGVAVNALLAVALLTRLPRLRMPLSRVWAPALLVAAGLEVLKSVGQLYVQRTQSNPAYEVVAGAVGLLVFLNVLNQLILFATALTATATTGQVTDRTAAPERAGISAEQQIDAAIDAVTRAILTGHTTRPASAGRTPRPLTPAQRAKLAALLLPADDSDQTH